jgi:hypothetical protein
MAALVQSQHLLTETFPMIGRLKVEDKKRKKKPVFCRYEKIKCKLKDSRIQVCFKLKTDFLCIIHVHGSK